MLYFPLALRKKPTKVAPASQKDDPKDTGAIPALPVLLRFLLSIGKKRNASDMLDGEDVQASSRTLKKKVAVQISHGSDTPHPPISVLQSYDSEQEIDELAAEDCDEEEGSYHAGSGEPYWQEDEEEESHRGVNKAKAVARGHDEVCAFAVQSPPLTFYSAGLFCRLDPHR